MNQSPHLSKSSLKNTHFPALLRYDGQTPGRFYTRLHRGSVITGTSASPAADPVSVVVVLSTRGLRNSPRHNAAPSAVVSTLDLRSLNAFTFKQEVFTL